MADATDVAPSQKPFLKLPLKLKLSCFSRLKYAGLFGPCAKAKCVKANQQPDTSASRDLRELGCTALTEIQ
jgi:hypothetical protein